MPFDRDKLARSVSIAMRKRNVEPERVEQTVSKIVQELESLGDIVRQPADPPPRGHSAGRPVSD